MYIFALKKFLVFLYGGKHHFVGHLLRPPLKHPFVFTCVYMQIHKTFVHTHTCMYIHMNMYIYMCILRNQYVVINYYYCINF
jgi:hypothetical protein